MADPRIANYLKNEKEQLQKLFNDYRSQSNDVDPLKGKMAVHALLARFQKHALSEDKILIPLSAKRINGKSLQGRIDALRRDHEGLCELISMILKKEEEGMTAKEEQEAFHVLLINHWKNEEEVLGTLDES